MEYLKIKNWERHQHYKDRCPPWIKLHVKILNDLKFCSLSRASKCLLMLLWILASENDGFVPCDITELRFRLRDETISESEINQLIKAGFINNCKHMIASGSKGYPETETETETEKRRKENKYSKDFLEFYSAYPLKKSKAKAFQVWKKLKPDLHTCLAALQSQMIEKGFLKAEKKFCPEWKHPATWLNQQCWEDDVNIEPTTRLEDAG